MILTEVGLITIYFLFTTRPDTLNKLPLSSFSPVWRQHYLQTHLTNSASDLRINMYTISFQRSTQTLQSSTQVAQASQVRQSAYCPFFQWVFPFEPRELTGLKHQSLAFRVVELEVWCPVLLFCRVVDCRRAGKTDKKKLIGSKKKNQYQ